MKIKQIIGPISETVKVTAVNPSTGEVTYKDDVTNVTTIVPKGAATPVSPGQVQVNTTQLQTGVPGQTAQLGIKVGDAVKLAGANTAGTTSAVAPTMGSPAKKTQMGEEGEEYALEELDDDDISKIKRLSGL